MKKILSTLLVGAMLVCMAPIAGVFAEEAAEDPYLSIDSVDEYIEFVKGINDGSITYDKAAVYEVNTDLDFKDETDVPAFNMPGDLGIDFKGHTISNLVREVTLKDHGYAGLIADTAKNFDEILNLNLKNCKLVVNIEQPEGYTPWVFVGAYMGKADRSYVSNVGLENVTIEVNGKSDGAVGTAYGEFSYYSFRSGEVAVSIKNVVIDAPEVNGGVGLVTGMERGAAGTEAGKTIVTGVSVSDLTITSKNEVKEDTYVGTDGGDELTVKEGASLSVKFSDNATGYVAPSKEEDKKEEVTDDKKEETTDDKKEESTDKKEESTDKKEPAKTGDATVFAVVLAVVALAGAAAISKKRSAC